VAIARLDDAAGSPQIEAFFAHLALTPNLCAVGAKNPL
jgi:hypothetical protein